MTFRLGFLLLIVNLISTTAVTAQVDSVIGQITNSPADTYSGGMSGNGRFVVFESRGDVATENPRNSDGNSEIFLFDYAQRRIYQITDTKSVLFDTNVSPTLFSNIRVDIGNTRPVISSDGKWIAFGSNATTSVAGQPANGTNPGLFNGNNYTSPTPSPTASPSSTATSTPTNSPTSTPTPGANLLTNDGNLEMWLYRIPDVADIADLSTGEEITPINLAGGVFTLVTNSPASQLPRAATSNNGAFVADDNHDASINDDGTVIAFGSTRDLVTCVGNSFPNDDNDEIFTFVRGAPSICPDGSGVGIRQVTKTPRGPISNPIYSKNPTISDLSGGGQRVVFSSTGENPIVGMTGGSNPLTSRNEEIHYADLIAGEPIAGTTKKQITTTTPTNIGNPVNILDLGRRMSRDGRYIAFDSYADLGTIPNGANKTSFALYLYDTQAAPPTAGNSPFRQIGPRSDADSAATGGDLQHYPTFTDYAGGTTATLLLETRLNIKPDGTIPMTASDGLNPDEQRQGQIYSYPLDRPATTATFTRLAKFPTTSFSVLSSTQLLPSNSVKRMAFNYALTEIGTGNFDRRSEVYYYLLPDVDTQTPVTINLATGATRLPVALASGTPTGTITPSPTSTSTSTPTSTSTSTPTATSTSSPSGTPSASPTATSTSTPQTPASVLGVSPGMSAILNYQSGIDNAIVARTAVGSIERSFTLPIELSGVTMTIDGAACGLKSVGRRKIEFIVPPGLTAALSGTNYPLVINNNGVEMKTSITIVPARPDIFNVEGLLGPGGRTKLFNVTNRVYTTEPFTVKTIMRKGNKLVPSVLRIYVTGVGSLAAGNINVRIGSSIISASTNPVLVSPGVYTVDFALPAGLAHAGDQPVVVTVSGSNVVYSSRLDDTTSRVFIL